MKQQHLLPPDTMLMYYCFCLKERAAARTIAKVCITANTPSPCITRRSLCTCVRVCTMSWRHREKHSRYSRAFSVLWQSNVSTCMLDLKSCLPSSLPRAVAARRARPWGLERVGGQHGQSWQTFLWVTAGLWFMLLFYSFVAGVVSETV